MGVGTCVGAGERFQQETKYDRQRMPRHALDWDSQPEAFKVYSDAPRIALPSPRLKGGTQLWDVLRNRSSVRRFSPQPLTLGEVSRLLWAAQGITHGSRDWPFRTAPSAGALYPVETYLVINRVESIDPGVYHYGVREHALEQLRSGDVGAEIARAALDQRIAYEAPIVFVWTAVFERCRFKYGQRAFRYVYLDAGHIAENVALAAVGQGLGSCQIAAIYDDEANALLGIDGVEESTLYMTVVGRSQ